MGASEHLALWSRLPFSVVSLVANQSLGSSHIYTLPDYSSRLFSHQEQYLASQLPIIRSRQTRPPTHSFIIGFPIKSEMKSFTVALLGLVATVYAASTSASSAASSASVVTPVRASSVPIATIATPYPSSMKGASQIADGQIQATGIAKPSGVARPTTTLHSGNSTVPFTGAGSHVGVSVGGLLAALAAAAVVLYSN